MPCPYNRAPGKSSVETTCAPRFHTWIPSVSPLGQNLARLDFPKSGPSRAISDFRFDAMTHVENFLYTELRAPYVVQNDRNRRLSGYGAHF